jgi:hypothetical protein
MGRREEHLTRMTFTKQYRKEEEGKQRKTRFLSVHRPTLGKARAEGS